MQKGFGRYVRHQFPGAPPVRYGRASVVMFEDSAVSNLAG